MPKKENRYRALCGSCGAALSPEKLATNSAATPVSLSYSRKKSRAVKRSSNPAAGSYRDVTAGINKITVASAWARLFGIFIPFFAPYWITENVESIFIFGGLWLAIAGPVFFLPDMDINNWEDDAKYMHVWFKVISSTLIKILMISLVLGMTSLLLFGRGRM